jgi:hypothetical protein
MTAPQMSRLLKGWNWRGIALFVDFIEEPHVLDGGHSLVAKRLNQLDPLISERLHDCNDIHEL